MTINTKEILEQLVKKIENLGEGSITCTHDLIDELLKDSEDIEFDHEALMELDALLAEECKKKHYILDKSMNKDLIISNPYDITFQIINDDPNVLDESGYIPKEYLDN